MSEGAGAIRAAADFERAFLALWGAAPNPAPTERQLAKWQERWDEAMQDPAVHELRVLGVGDEEHERAKWESGVRAKLHSALFALQHGLGFEWDKPYDYGPDVVFFKRCPICGEEAAKPGGAWHECDEAKLAAHEFTGLLGAIPDGATYGGSAND